VTAPLHTPDLVDRFLAGYARRRWRGFITRRRWLGRPSIKVTSRHGASFNLLPGDYIDNIVLHEGFYESEVLGALRRFAAPGVVLWDIGANFGLHAVSAALAEPAMQVHAFEPNPASFARLQLHTRDNQAGVRCWPLALGDRDGTATLHANASGNPGMTTLTPGATTRFDAQVEVRLARGDTLVARGELPAPHVIKLDVEGGKLAVRTGLGGLLTAPTLRAVVFETCADLLTNPTGCPSASLLLAAGFKLSALRRTEASSYSLGNFLATRPA
jgi:FkbM family methyltransferase